MLLEFGCKGSANEWKNKIYFDFSRMQHNLHGPKGHKGTQKFDSILVLCSLIVPLHKVLPLNNAKINEFLFGIVLA